MNHGVDTSNCKGIIGGERGNFYGLKLVPSVREHATEPFGFAWSNSCADRVPLLKELGCDMGTQIAGCASELEKDLNFISFSVHKVVSSNELTRTVDLDMLANRTMSCEDLYTIWGL